MPACAACVRALVQSGISRLWRHAPEGRASGCVQQRRLAPGLAACSQCRTPLKEHPLPATWSGCAVHWTCTQAEWKCQGLSSYQKQRGIGGVGACQPVGPNDSSAQLPCNGTQTSDLVVHTVPSKPHTNYNSTTAAHSRPHTCRSCAGPRSCRSPRGSPCRPCCCPLICCSSCLA